MFICKDCAIESIHWVFDLEMIISHGCCQVCKKVRPCADLKAECVDTEKVAERGKK